MPFEDVVMMIFFCIIMFIVGATVILLLFKTIMALLSSPAIKGLFVKNKAVSEIVSEQINVINDKAEPSLETVNEDDFSCGMLNLIDVDEQTAAMIMAIVSDETKLPLSELCFKTIRLVK